MHFADDPLHRLRPRSAPRRAESGAYREFDFWAGNWIVKVASGEEVGRNWITVEQRGCVLIERWTSADGSTGMSLNFYDPVARDLDAAMGEPGRGAHDDRRTRQRRDGARGTAALPARKAVQHGCAGRGRGCPTAGFVSISWNPRTRARPGPSGSTATTRASDAGLASRAGGSRSPARAATRRGASALRARARSGSSPPSPRPR